MFAYIYKTTLIAVLIILVSVLSACSGEKKEKLFVMQQRDKNLSCSQVMLEINEAEFHRKTAEKNRSFGFETVISPFTYVKSYMGSSKTIKHADSRIDYLNRIYDILDCDNPQSRMMTEMRAAQYIPQNILQNEQPQKSHSVYSSADYQLNGDELIW